MVAPVADLWARVQGSTAQEKVCNLQTTETKAGFASDWVKGPAAARAEAGPDARDARFRPSAHSAFHLSRRAYVDA